MNQIRTQYSKIGTKIYKKSNITKLKSDIKSYL